MGISAGFATYFLDWITLLHCTRVEVDRCLGKIALKRHNMAYLLLLLTLPTISAAAETFGIDDYLSLRGLAEIALSPDGQYIAYTNTAANLEDDHYGSSVQMLDVKTGEVLQMTDPSKNASSPQWSPNGRYLSFLSSRDEESAQVWLFDRRGGDPQALTDLPQSIDAYAWSPDSSKVLLLAEDATPADLDEEPPANPRPYVIDRLQFKQDYVGYLDRYRSHIHVVDVETAEIKQVTDGDFEDSEPAWSPDSKKIAFVSNRTETPDRNRNTDIWIVDISATSKPLRQLTTSESIDSSPSWSPDGKTIVYTSTDTEVLPVYAIPRTTLIDVKSQQTRIVDALDEVRVFSPRFSSSGDKILAIAEQHGEQKLVAIDSGVHNVDTVIGGRHVVDEFVESASGDIYVLASQPNLPAEIYAVSGSASKQLSFANQSVMSDIEIGRVEKYTLSSFDDTAMDTFVVFPPGYNKKRAYPGLLYIHGGPQSQWDYRFDAEAQLLAAKGYVVVMPNPRGSFGYGQDFATAIYRDWGGVDYKDVIAAMNFAIDEGWVDADKTAVYGWSYGGIMTNYVITKTRRFRAAITGASATLYVANYGHDQYQRWWEEELGLPWLEENREHWERLSPFYYLDKVTTPTLVVGGEHDWNVPILNSEQLYIGLKRQGVETQLVVYPEEGHVLSVPSYERDLYERYFDWLARFVTE